MKLHILIVAMLLSTTASFADVMTSSTIETTPFSYLETWDQQVTLTNVLLTYHPNVGSNIEDSEFRLDLTAQNGELTTIDMVSMAPTGVFDINPNIVTESIEVKLLRKDRGPNGVWVPTTQFDYEWNIPEPATMGLVVTAGFVLMVIRRIKRV